MRQENRLTPSPSHRQQMPEEDCIGEAVRCAVHDDDGDPRCGLKQAVDLRWDQMV